MKKAALIPFLLSTVAINYSLSGCTPVVVVGAAAGVGITVAVDRRSTANIIEDQAIEVQASDFIYSNDKFGKKVHVDVTSMNGIVLLTGEVPKEEYRQAIYDKVVRMRPVKEVINKIEVRDPLPMSEKTNDTWITSKVKSTLIANKGIPTRTKVVTANNRVYLMGIVSSKEAEQILSIVKNIDGVENVTPLFEGYKTKLKPSLAAQSHKPEKVKQVKEKTLEEELEEEDMITTKPYVLQPPIILKNDE